MRKIIAGAAVLVSCFLLSVEAHDETTYVADVSGIESNICKQKIARSIGKLSGVKTIRISKKTENTHVLRVIAKGSIPITRHQAVEALGKHEERYKITSWTMIHEH